MARPPLTDLFVPSLLSVVGMASVYLVHLRIGPLSNVELFLGSAASVIFATMLSVAFRMVRPGAEGANGAVAAAHPAGAVANAGGEALGIYDRLVRTVTAVEPPETLLPRALAAIARELGVKRIAAHAVEAGVPRFAAQEGYGPNQLAALTEGPIPPIVAWASRERRAFGGGQSSEPALRDALAGRIPPVCCVPVVHAETTLAVITVDEMVVDTGPSRARLREMLALIATPLAARMEEGRREAERPVRLSRPVPAIQLADEGSGGAGRSAHEAVVAALDRASDGNEARELRAALETADHERERLVAEIARLQSALARAENDREELRESLEASSMDAARHLEEMEELRSSMVTGATQEGERRAAEVDELRAALAKATEERDRRTAEILQLQASLQVASQVGAGRAAELEKLRASAAVTSHEVAELKAALAAAEQARDRGEVEAAQMRVLLRAAEARGQAMPSADRNSGEREAIAIDAETLVAAGTPRVEVPVPSAPAADPVGAPGGPGTVRDPVTRLFTWQHAYDILAGEVTRSQRYGHPLSFLLLRVDGLTEVTRDIGPAARDDLLAAVSPILDRTRKGIDLAFRYSDEVVGILLPHISRKQVSSLAVRFLEKLVEIPPPASVAARMPRLSASAGLTSMPEVFASAEGVLQAATGGLDAARKGGGNQAVWVATDGKGFVLRGPGAAGGAS